MDKLKEFGQKVVEYEHIFKILAVIILVITAFLLFGPKGNNKTITMDKENVSKNEVISKEEENEKRGASGKVYVDISGEVKKPGVYEVSSDSRIFEVIEKAGGLTGKADTGAINQAELVKDGQKIVISMKGDNRNVSGSNMADTSSKSAGASHNGISQGKININSADANELQKIHGVGPSTAEKIIKFRSSNGNFKVIEDLKKVNGIGEKTFEKIKDYITV